ncbi:hypothetical protein AB0B45_02240 [Nonomuraea sp. NPDC049152]|uniref:hypothetical protein n=1 Tax=Nonomuraea sp. NPDC049152 TaxID=3154350 RepID=UPI0033D1401B
MKGLLAPSPERERARLEAEQVRIEQERLRAEARHERALQQVQHEAEVARRNTILAEERKARVAAEAEADAEQTRARWAERRARWAERARVAGRLAVMSTTNLGVNGVAVSGQAMAFMQRGLPPLWAVLAAGIVESVAVYVSWHAHVALREGDSAFVTRMISYGVGAGAGYLSYTHVPDYPELFAACSLASPWLWSMHSRHLHRQDLRAAGLIDPRAPKFSVLRWLLHTKETFAAFKWAISEGVQSPHIAVEVVRTRRAVRMAWQSVEDAQAKVIAAQRDQLQLALTNMAALSQELYGMDPDAADAMQKVARFVNQVGAGMFPMYRPQPAGELRPADEQADETRTDGAHKKRTDGGRRSGGRLRRLLFGRGRTADENERTDGGRTAGESGQSKQTNTADEKRTDGGRTPDEKRTDEADEKPARKRTDGADSKPRPGGRSGKKRTAGRRPSVRTNGGRTAGTDDLGELLPLGRTILAEHQRTGARLTRDSLAAAVKADGRTISNERASALLRLLHGNGSSARTKKAADGGPSATNNADETASSAQTNEVADGGPSGADEEDGNDSSANDKGAN